MKAKALALALVGIAIAVVLLFSTGSAEANELPPPSYIVYGNVTTHSGSPAALANVTLRVNHTTNTSQPLYVDADINGNFMFNLGDAKNDTGDWFGNETGYVLYLEFDGGSVGALVNNTITVTGLSPQDLGTFQLLPIHNLDQDTYYYTIQAAIDNATAGETIFVPNGTYYENVVVDVSINLTGEDRNGTIIDGGGSGDVVNITADWVNVSGFTVTNSGGGAGDAGIELHSVQNCRIESTNCSNNYYGIRLWSSSNNNTIANNTCNSNNWYGIILQSSSGNNNITGNNASSNAYDGIYLWSSSNNTLANNTVSNNDYGIYLWSSSNNTLANNTVTNNECHGIDLESSSSNTLMGNTMADDGIVIWGDQLQHWNTHTIDTSNTVNDKSVQYWKDQNSGTVPMDAGQVILANCTNVVVENQDVNNGTFGIELGFSSCNTLTNNTASNNVAGILLFSSDNNTLTGNTASSNNYDGIWLSSSDNNTIINNTVSNNDYGIYLESSSSSNIIYHNNFISNTIHAYDDGTNTWNLSYPEGGNYYDNHTTPDVNGDGFVDSPFIISGGVNQDFLPHTVLDGWLNSHPAQNVLNQDQGLWYVTIQSAIDNATAGDTIFVPNGTYYENVVVDKAINLTGEDRNGTIIDGGGVGDVVYVTVDWVNVSGFTVVNSGGGAIDACILLESVQNCRIENTNCSNNRRGICLDGSSNNIVANNTVSNNVYGILLVFSSGNNITGNTMVEDGISIWGDSLAHWNTHLIDTTNTVNGKPVYYWKNQTSGTVPSGAGQVLLANCTNVVVESQDVSNGSVGISFGFSSNNTLVNNNVSSNNGHGISLYFSSNNTLVNNTVTNNVYGISLYFSSNNTLVNNTATNSIYGIYLVSSSNNNITGNNASNNGYGIYLEWSSDNNLIYHNNFISNTNHVSDDGINTWNLSYPGGGNYYDNYTTPDNNTDGFVDSPFIISGGGGNQDFLPHTVPDGWLNSHPAQNVLNQDQGLWYVTIQAAIDNATTGDTIWVSNGTYYENVVVDKAINLTGEDRNGTIIDGGGVGDVVYVTADWVNVSGFTLTNSGGGAGDAGIELQSVQNCRIENTNCSNNNGIGIYLDGSSNNTIANNTATNNEHCIWLSSSSSNTIANNTMVDDGIVMRGDTLAHWNTHTIVTSNTVNGKPVYYWKNQTSGTVPSGAGQVLLANCTNVIVENQNASDCTAGITLGFSSNNNITGNNVSNNVYGIYLYSSSNNNIVGNNVSNNVYGIYIESSNGNTIYHNNFISNTNHASDDGTNAWNLSAPIGGNYYDGHTTPDANNDGFVDNLYNIPGGGGNQDLLPFAKENGWDRVLNQDTGIWYLTIQAAIDNATVGDTILVPNGTYYENVVVDKAINLMGEDRDGTIIDGGGVGDVVNITADWVNVSGFTVTNGGSGVGDAGIHLDNVQNCRIENINASANNMFGILLYGSSNNTLVNNTCSGNEDGFYFWQSNNNAITGNTVTTNNQYGLWLVNSDNNTLTNNNVSSNTLVGFWLFTSDNNTLTSNSVANNGVGIDINSLGNNNIIYHNNFISNTIHASDDGTNTWNHPALGGNHWDNWTIPDTNNDGFVDAPFNISGVGGNQDPFPFTTSNGWDKPPPESGDWVISWTGIYKDQTIVIDGRIILESTADVTFRNVTLYCNGITVEAGGKLAIDPSPVYVNGTVYVDGELRVYDNTELLFNCSSDGEFGLQVNATGILFIQNSIIMSNNTYAYWFNVEAGANLTVEDSIIRDCGWGTNPGLWLGNTNATFNIVLFQNNTVGVTLDNSSASITFENCTWLANGLDVNSTNGTVILLNTTLGAGNVSASNTGEVWFRQYLSIQVTEYWEGTPVPSVDISIEDNASFSANVQTDANGELHWYVVTTLKVDSVGTTSYNPFYINASKAGYTGNATVHTLDNMYLASITIDVHPVPTFLTPSAGDNVSGFVALEARLDAANTNPAGIDNVSFWYNASGTWTWIGEAGYNVPGNYWYFTWSTAGLDLTNVELRVNATDTAGGEGSTIIILVEVDNTPPSPVFTTPTVNTNLTGTVELGVTSDPDTDEVWFYYKNASTSWLFIEQGVWNGTGWNYTWDTTGIDLTDVTLVARARDNVGLWGPGFLAITEIDNTVPSPILLTVAENANLTGSVWLNVTSDPDTVYVEFGYYNDTMVWHYIDNASWNGTLWCYLWDTSAINETNVILCVNATDNLGLWGNVTINIADIDNNAPSPSFITPKDGWVIGGVYNITIQEDDAETIAIYWHNGVSWTFLDNANPVGDGTWWYLWNTTTAIPPSVMGAQLRANATDNVGLNGTCLATGLELDNTAPYMVLNNLSSGDTISGVFEINYTASADTVEIEFYWKNHSAGPYQFIGLDSDVTGFFNWTTPSMLNYELVDLMYKPRDSVGNTWFDITENIYVDNIAPAPFFITPHQEENITGVYLVTVQCENNTDNVTLHYCKAPTWHFIGYASYNPGTGYWECSWNTGFLNEPIITIRATVIDNVSQQGESFVTDVAIDNIGPSQTIPVVDDGTYSFVLDTGDKWLRATPVLVETTITEFGTGIVEVILYYTNDSSEPTNSSMNVTMTCVGGAYPTFVYQATIPPAPHLSTVRFYIYSVDYAGLSFPKIEYQYHVDGEAPGISFLYTPINETSPHIYAIENASGRYIYYSSLMSGEEQFEINGTATDSGSGLRDANATGAFGDIQTMDFAPGNWSWFYSINNTHNVSGSINVTFYDNVGNNITITYHYIYDNTPPTANLNTSETSPYIYWNGTVLWYDNNMSSAQTLTLLLEDLLEDGSGMQNITFSGFWAEPDRATTGPWQMGYNITNGDTQEGQINITLVDKVGNNITLNITVMRDVEVPAYTDFFFNESSLYIYWNGSCLWYGDKMLTAQELNATIEGLGDLETGIREIVFPAVWEENEQTTTNPYRVYDISFDDNYNDVYTIQIYDNVNHLITIDFITQKDTASPTILSDAIIESSKWLYVNASGIFYGTGMGGLAQDLWLNGSADDSASGMGWITFSTAFGDTLANDTSAGWWHAHYTIDDTSTGSGVIIITVYDNVGNPFIMSYPYYVDNTSPTVLSAVLSPSSPVTVGGLNIAITFSEAMETSMPLAVSIGTSSPFDSYDFTGTWLNNRTWEGVLPIALSMDGTYTINITGAVDKVNNTMVTNISYQLTVDTGALDNTIDLPLPNTVVVNQLSVTYTLGEDSKNASLVFVWVSGTPDTNAPYTHNLTGGELTAGPHTIEFTPSALIMSDGAYYNIILQSTDLAGNDAPQVLLVNIASDRTAPVTTATLPPPTGNNSWYITNVTINLSAVEAFPGYAIWYKVDASPSWTIYTGEFDIEGSGPHTLRYNATDALGNTEPTKQLDIKIDLEDPTTTITPIGTPGGLWNRTLEITLGRADATSGINVTYWSIDAPTGPWTPYDAPFNVPEGGVGNPTVYAYSVDNAGRDGPMVSTVFQVDATPPSTTHAFSDATLNGWYNSTVTITLTTTEALSGNDTTYYILDGDLYNSSTFPVVILVNGEGIHNLTYWTVDVAGNVEGQNTMVFFKIDTLAPASQHSLPDPDGTGDWYMGEVTVTLSATDGIGNVSGIPQDGIEYNINMTGWITYYGPFTITAEGNNTLWYRAMDNAGNVEVYNDITVSIDKSPPTTTMVDVIATLGENDWYTTTFVFNLSASDNIGPSTTMYSTDGGYSWHSYTGTLTLSSTNTYTVMFYSTDQAGNVESTKTRTIKVDVGLPNSVLSTGGTVAGQDWYISMPTISMSASDQSKGSGIVERWYRLDSGPWNIYSGPVSITHGIHLFEARATDGAGNNGTIVNTTVKVDINSPATQLPPPTGTLGDNGWYTSDVDITLDGNETDPYGSGLSYVRYKLDGTTHTYTGTFTITSQGPHTLQYWSVDNASNQETANTVVIKIDSLAPPTPNYQIATPMQGESGWRTKNATVNFLLKDDPGEGSGTGSGTNYSEYRIGEDSWTPGPTAFIAGEGIYNLSFRAVDNAGNAGPNKTITVKIDLYSPWANVVLTPLTPPTGWYQGEVEVNITGYDSGSNVIIKYNLNGGGDQAYSGPIKLNVSGQHTVGYTIIDESLRTFAGQVAFNIDKDLPHITTFAPVGGNMTDDTAVFFSLEAVDNTSGVVEYRIRNGTGTWSGPYAFQNIVEYLLPTLDWTYTIEVEVRDAANRTASASTEIRLDRTAPVISLDTPLLTNTPSLAVTYTATETGSGMATITYQTSTDGNNWASTPVFSNPTQLFLTEGVNKIRALATDNVGNQNYSVVYNVTLDSISPTLAGHAIWDQPSALGAATNLSLEFPEDMNVSVPLNVSYLSPTGMVYVNATGGWTNPTTWNGTLTAAAGYGDGSYEISVTGGEDMAGNPMPLASFQWAVDAVLPIVSTALSSEGTELGVGPTTINITFDEPMQATSITVEVDAGVTVTIDGSWQGTQTWKGTLTVFHGIGDGPASLSIQGAIDEAGNPMNPTVYADCFDIDTTPPIILFATMTAQDTIVLELNEIVASASVNPLLFVLSQGSVVSATPMGNNITLLVNASSYVIPTLFIDPGLEDLYGNVMSAITTPLADAVLPEMLEAETSSLTKITLTWTEEVQNSTMDNEGFQLASYLQLYVVSISHDSVTTVLTLNRSLGDGETPTITLVGTVKDLSDNTALTQSLPCQDGLRPHVVSAETVSMTKIRITFSEPLQAMSKDKFSVSTSTIRSIAHSGSVVTLTLDTSFLPYQTPTITTYPGITDLAGNEAESVVAYTTVDGIPNVAPTLTSAGVSSEAIYENEILSLSVLYTDEDNEAPASVTAKLMGAGALALQMVWEQGVYDQGVTASCTIEGLSPGTYTVSFSASDGKVTSSLTSSISFTVLKIEYRNITLSTSTPQVTLDMADGRADSVPFNMRNTGNVDFTAFLNTSVPSSWYPSLAPTYSLQVDNTYHLSLLFIIPEDLESGWYNQTITATPINGGIGDTIGFAVRVQRGEPAPPHFDVPDTTKGKEVDIVITVENTGDGVLKGATLYLYDGTEGIAYMELPSIAAGAETSISVSWTPKEDGSHTLTASIVYDTDASVTGTSTTNVASQSISESLFSPENMPVFMAALLFTSLVWAIVVALVIYRHRRRRKGEDAL